MHDSIEFSPSPQKRATEPGYPIPTRCPPPGDRVQEPLRGPRPLPSGKGEPAILVLEDGTCFEGQALGKRGEQSGEVVFSTPMSGYQELLTDPSFCGQILVLTLAHVGNVGINFEDNESERCWPSGFVIGDLPRRYSNWRAHTDLDSWLESQGVVGICDLDTRALVRHIRTRGAMRGMVSSRNLSIDLLQEQALQAPPMSGRDLVGEVSCTQREVWPAARPHPLRVVAYDFGIKRRMLQLLTEHGVEVLRVGARTRAAEVLSLKPDGVFLSNGPGDPAALGDIVEQVRELLGKLPMFGICLGHQLLGRALGAETFKLKFGHRGGNQPVLHIDTGRVEITTQNHGFAVDPHSLDERARVTHINLNDKTCEGLEAPQLSAFSVQYHPESSPGPHDSRYLFGRFVDLMGSRKV